MEGPGAGSAPSAPSLEINTGTSAATTLSSSSGGIEATGNTPDVEASAGQASSLTVTQNPSATPTLATPVTVGTTFNVQALFGQAAIYSVAQAPKSASTIAASVAGNDNVGNMSMITYTIPSPYSIPPAVWTVVPEERCAGTGQIIGPHHMHHLTGTYLQLPKTNFKALALKQMLSTFNVKLPKEIRRMIWKYALPDSRVVLLALYQVQRPPAAQSTLLITAQGTNTGYAHHMQMLDMALTCRESWEVFTEHYKQLKVPHGPTVQLGSPCSVRLPFFDSERDTLVITPFVVRVLSGPGLMPDLSQLRNIALTGQFLGGDTLPDNIPEVMLHDVLTTLCPKLREFSLIMNDEGVQNTNTPFHLIDVDADLVNAVTRLQDDQHDSLVGHRLDHIIESASTGHARLERLRKVLGLSKIVFRTCLVMNELDNEDLWYVKLHYLMPWPRHPIHTSFKFMEPIMPFRCMELGVHTNGKWWYFTSIDGKSLDCMYDGYHGVDELFERRGKGVEDGAEGVLAILDKNVYGFEL